MKQTQKCIILIMILFSAFTATNAGNTMNNSKQQSAHMFPKAKDGNVRYVINLKKQKNEEELNVEIIVGKTMMVDCNRHFFPGKITEETLDGWGYPYYIAQTNGQAAGTKMLCPEEKKHTEFISIPSLKMQYNSKLPIVIYVPEGFEVKYRIWKAGKYMNAMN